MPISGKVYDLLIKEGIAEEHILEVINNIQRDIESHYAVKLVIEEAYFNLTKDMIWYNLERADHLNTLEDFGSKYKRFMNLFDNGNEILYDELIEVLTDVQRIKRDLNGNCNLVQLTGNEELFELKTKVYFIDKRKDKQIEKKKKEKNSLVCTVSEELSAYKMEEIKINSLLETLIEGLEKALKNHSKVTVTFV
jgi:hypothetical protein